MNSENQLLQTFKGGIWDDNPGLVQLLGLCPLLAITTSFVNGLGLGLATVFVLTLSNVLVSATRRWIRPEIRIPMYVLIIASLVTAIELLVLAYFPELGRSLGIFIPLIVTNCAIVARAEVFASRNDVIASLVDGISMGCGFALLLCAVGMFRELLGHGSLFSRLDMLFGGDTMSGIVILDGGFLLAILPPGAFMSLALFVAMKNVLDRRKQKATRGSLARRLR